MKLFLQNICLNESCANCHYGKLPRIADITLGDYWNIAQVHPQMDDDKGTSVVLLNTKHGEALFESISKNITQCASNINFAIAGNKCIVRSSLPHKKRAQFFADLDKFSIEDLVKKYLPEPSIFTKIARKFFRIAKKIVKYFAGEKGINVIKKMLRK